MPIPVQSTMPLNVSSSDTNTLTYILEQFQKGMNTAEIVMVNAITTTEDGAKRLTVTPILNQVSAGGQSIQMAPIYNVPFIRMQAGANAIIIDPEVGDIGLVVYCQRDISSVKRMKFSSLNPSTNRMMSHSDAVYIATIYSINQTENRKIEFVNGSGATGKIVITPNGTLEVDGNMTVSGNVIVTGTVTAADYISAAPAVSGSYNTHVHTQTATPTTEGPIQL